MQMDGMHRVGLQCVCIWMQLHADALHVDADASICMQNQSGWSSGRTHECICMHIDDDMVK